jgi:hypothetical protein
MDFNQLNSNLEDNEQEDKSGGPFIIKSGGHRHRGDDM